MSSFSASDLLPISALQHLSFCRRQWAIIHLEQTWIENSLTCDGNLLHTRVDSGENETRRGIRVARSLKIRSYQLGLTGCADVVEFLQGDWPCEESVHLKNRTGKWKPVPVEYKRGQKKIERCDEVQLCAQAMCLEEMLNVKIKLGQIYYGKTKRRHSVAFDDELREITNDLITRLHELTRAGVTPPPTPGPYCDSCSLKSNCLPEVLVRKNSARRHIDESIKKEMGAF